MELDDLPQSEAGAGDSQSWYSMSVQEEEWNKANQKLASEVRKLRALARSSSSTAGPTRPKALEVTYKRVAGCDLPCNNITSPAIGVYYLTLTTGRVRALSTQVLCMISEYHMACVVNGPSTTSPIPSQEIEDKLPSLKSYALQKGLGLTDMRVQDHKAKNL